MPIAAPGELNERPLIRITLRINPPPTDSDPKVGNTDGTNQNQFSIIQHGSSSSIGNPCNVQNGQQNGRSGQAGNPVAGEYTLLFEPSRRFGSCSTNTGFQTDARFNSQIDVSKGFSLVVHKDDAIEQYFFHYFLIEFL